VLHAAAIGEPGALYVLEMGEPIRVLDLARNMIRLSGFVPDVDIPITFIGLRPGEKLTEDLVGPDESVEASSVEKILRVRTTGAADGTCFDARVAELERLAAEGDAKAVIAKLAEIVPALGRSAR
jgi:FlaA1/EpsC-like NDP-sugar epimerase